MYLSSSKEQADGTQRPKYEVRISGQEYVDNMPEAMLSCKASQMVNTAKEFVGFCTHSFSRVKIKAQCTDDPNFRIQPSNVKQLLLNYQADNFIC